MKTKSIRHFRHLMFAGSAAALFASHSARADTFTWTTLVNGDAKGDWADLVNWSGGTLPTTTSDTADFSTLNITALSVVSLKGDRSINKLIFADATTASHDWWLASGTPSSLTLGGTSPEISVINRSATISANLAGSDNWSKTGAGTLILFGGNSYSGVTTISAGTLVVRNNASLGNTTGNTVISGTGNLSLDGSAGNLTIAENIAITTSTSGSITNSSGSNKITGSITLESNVDFRNTNSRLTISGGISGGNVNVALNGLYTIDTNPMITSSLSSRNMTFTGNSNDAASATQLNVGGNAWGKTQIMFNGYLMLGGSNYMPATAGAEFGWQLISHSHGTLDLNGFNQTVAYISSNSNFLTVSGGNQNITGGGTLTVNHTTGEKTYFGRITDGTTATALTKTGAGTQVIDNQSGTASNYSGATTISAGTLRAAGGTAIGDTSAVSLANVAATTFDLASSETIGSLAGGGATGGNVTLNANTLTTGGNNSSTAYAGVISGIGGALTKTGSGTLTLSGTNTYTGVTQVNAGTLFIGASGSLADTTTTIGVGGTLAGGGTIGGATAIQGTHNPGFSPGTQTFTNGLSYADTATLNWELTANSTAGRGTSYDAVDVTGGSFALATGAEIDLTFGGSVDFLNAFWGLNQEWLVVDLSGSATAADSNVFTIGAISGGGWNSDLGTFGILRKDGSSTEDAVYLTWTAVPEPSAALLGGLGLLVLLRRRRCA